jgi:hypothetical protein
LFKSDTDFLSKAEEYRSYVMSPTKNADFEKPHPFVIQTKEGCDAVCVAEIRKDFKNGRLFS